MYPAPKVRFINYYQQNLDKRTPDENVYVVNVQMLKRVEVLTVRKSQRLALDGTSLKSRSSHNQLEQISRSIVGEGFGLKDYRWRRDRGEKYKGPR